MWLTWLGSYLVESQAPYQADAISVLGGDFRGDRLITAANLAKNGFAPRVLVSGSGSIYGRHEGELAVAWAVSLGYDKKMFVRVPGNALSTRDEAQDVVRCMRQLHVQRFLLVTSAYHTRRAARTFRQEAPDLPFRVVASPDPFFTADGWWRSREGQKTFAFEWVKTIANWAGD